ncbi:hypothetical protein K0A97_02940 [Patescibacteria group bacterium]|nr:hypothetical protein [Patescibacteria group bacterium]
MGDDKIKMKKTQKIIVLLLFLSILFSFASIMLNISLATNLNPSQFNLAGFSNSGISSQGNIGLSVLPSGGEG